MRKTFSVIAPVSVALALASCAQKARIVNEPTMPGQGGGRGQQPQFATMPGGNTGSTPVVPIPAPQSNDGLRMPDMLGLPDDKELRTGSPAMPEKGEGAVISRPPTEPPPRQKPGGTATKPE